MGRITETPVIAPNLRCPYCGSRAIIYDEERGTLVCSECGSVIEQHPMVNTLHTELTDEGKKQEYLVSPYETFSSKKLTIKGIKKTEEVDLVNVVAANIMSEIDLRMEYDHTSFEFKRMIASTVFNVAKYAIEKLGDYTIHQRAALSTCLAEAIMDGMRIIYDEKRCKTYKLSRNFTRKLKEIMMAVPKLTKPIPRDRFSVELVRLGIVRHPGQLVMLPDDRAYDLLSTMIANFYHRRVTCTINKLRFVRLFSLTAGLKGINCGGGIDHTLFHEYVVHVANVLGLDYARLAMVSAYDDTPGMITVRLPKFIANIIDLIMVTPKVPKYWLLNEELEPVLKIRTSFNIFNTINDLGVLTARMNFSIDGQKLEDVLTKGKTEELEMPTLTAMRVLLNSTADQMKRDIMYNKILIGGIMLLYRFLKRVYPDLLEDMGSFRKVAETINKRVKITVPNEYRHHKEAVKSVLSKPSDGPRLKFKMVRTINDPHSLSFREQS